MDPWRPRFTPAALLRAPAQLEPGGPERGHGPAAPRWHHPAGPQWRFPRQPVWLCRLLGLQRLPVSNWRRHLWQCWRQQLFEHLPRQRQPQHSPGWQGDGAQAKARPAAVGRRHHHRGPQLPIQQLPGLPVFRDGQHLGSDALPGLELQPQTRLERPRHPLGRGIKRQPPIGQEFPADPRAQCGGHQLGRAQRHQWHPRPALAGQRHHRR